VLLAVAGTLSAFVAVLAAGLLLMIVHAITGFYSRPVLFALPAVLFVAYWRLELFREVGE
jgi:hypothetical protein